jgi:hypothetical protein
MAKIGYYDREGDAISHALWKEKRADAAYTMLKEFDNGSVRVTLEWTGKVTDPTNSWRDTWALFTLGVLNYDSTGTPREDPLMHGKTFSEEEDAVKAYSKFLTDWTESHMETNGVTGEEELVEEGNVLAPAIPDDPNRPTTELDDDDGVGAW